MFMLLLTVCYGRKAACFIGVPGGAFLLCERASENLQFAYFTSATAVSFL